MTSAPEPGKPSRVRRSWRFTEQFRTGGGGYCVSAANSEEDFNSVNRLWNAVYGDECGWLKPDETVRYLDRYHLHSTYLLARVEGQTVGTMRLVVDSREGLPVTQFVDISDLMGENRALVECQRLMILPEFRNGQWPELPYGVLGALFKGCLHWCITNSLTHIIADLFTDTKTTPISILRSMGFEDTGKEFVDTELSESCTSIALILKVGELFSRSFRTDNEFYRYLMEYDKNIDVYSPNPREAR